MARLGELLLAEKVITSKELDAALENHILHGVRLGTCLVEMGCVSDDDLARCLAKKTGKPFLTKDQLLACGAQYISAIAPAAIKKHRIVPVGIQGPALRIATDHVLSSRKQTELETFIGRPLEFVAASGYAVDCFLEQMFGTNRPGRFLPRFARSKVSETRPEEVQKPSEGPASIVIDGVEWKSLGEVTQDDAGDWPGDELPAPTAVAAEAPLLLSNVAERLSQARTRDDVAKAVLDFLSDSCETAALVIVRDGLVRGWKASTNRKLLADFDASLSPVETFPDLQQCIEMKKPFFTESLSTETRLLLRKPHACSGRAAFFPLFIQHRVIAVLMCDGAARLDSVEVIELCRKASYALEILVLRSKILSA